MDHNDESSWESNSTPEKLCVIRIWYCMGVGDPIKSGV